jgi:hypothetical protein
LFSPYALRPVSSTAGPDLVESTVTASALASVVTEMTRLRRRRRLVVDVLSDIADGFRAMGRWTSRGFAGSRVCLNPPARS